MRASLQVVLLGVTVTFLSVGDRWMIVDHHSSAMPSPPK
jgi:hypothetical protein